PYHTRSLHAALPIYGHVGWIGADPALEPRFGLRQDTAASHAPFCIEENLMHLIEAHGARIPAIGLGTMTLKQGACVAIVAAALRSEEHTSELQSRGQ